MTGLGILSFEGSHAARGQKLQPVVADGGG